MGDPWGTPPIPTIGDDIDDTTYAGVGRVLSRWEDVENQLSFLYAHFTGRGISLAASREYGAARIFDDRSRNLQSAAMQYFYGHADQELEGNFLEMMRHARGFSVRRNDVAHGIVRAFLIVPTMPPSKAPEDTSVGYVTRMHFLVPPHYTKQKYDANNKPAYSYASPQLLSLAGHLHDLGRVASGLYRRLRQ